MDLVKQGTAQPECVGLAHEDAVDPALIVYVPMSLSMIFDRNSNVWNGAIPRSSHEFDIQGVARSANALERQELLGVCVTR